MSQPPMKNRSYWIPGSYAPALSENRNSFVRLLKNKGFKEERMTKVGVYAIGSSTTSAWDIPGALLLDEKLRKAQVHDRAGLKAPPCL
jgi:hypothetical protein